MKPARNIHDETDNNNEFKKFIHTTSTLQLALMSLNPGQEVGEEIHEGITQFIKIESGYGKAIIDNVEQELRPDTFVIVPPGTRHNIINTSKSKLFGSKLKFYTIYSPPEEPNASVGQVEQPPSDKFKSE